MADYTIQPLECDLFDTRLRSRHLEKSILDGAKLKAHLEALPDLADEGEEYVVHLGVGPEDEEEEEA
jgi:hypothetical protein